MGHVTVVHLGSAGAALDGAIAVEEFYRTSASKAEDALDLLLWYGFPTADDIAVAENLIAGFNDMADKEQATVDEMRRAFFPS